MTDPVPSKESDTPRTDTAQGAWELHGDRWVLADFAKQLERELTAARTALRGIQSCSTCEACRGAATRALGGSQQCPPPLVFKCAYCEAPFTTAAETDAHIVTCDARAAKSKPAHEREMPHCANCSCPPYDAEALKNE